MIVKVGTAKISLRLHETHGLIGELRRVVDGGDSGLRRKQRAGFTHGMHRDAATPAGRLLDARLQLRGRVLIGRMQHPIPQGIRPGLIDFHEIRALLVLLADHRDDLLGVVGMVGVREGRAARD
jgi:hypothetical protein